MVASMRSSDLTLAAEPLASTVDLDREAVDCCVLLVDTLAFVLLSSTDVFVAADGSGSKNIAWCVPK